MRINADFSKAVNVVPHEDAWISSPETGVDRLMLDRIGDEVARATSIVRYAAGSSFAEHEHAKGEEFLVLEGVFSDEHADYVAGTYVRNPPGSGHAPHSTNGCQILVKLRQFDPHDLDHVVIDTNDTSGWQDNEDGSRAVLPLHTFKSESVQMLRLPSGSSYTVPADGCEVFVVSGSIMLNGEAFPAEAWLRFPLGYAGDLIAASDVLLWMKQGHLPD